MFKLVLPYNPINGGVNEGVNENGGVNEGTNRDGEGVNRNNEGVNTKHHLLEIITKNEGINVIELMVRLDRSKTTVERYIRVLKSEGKIEFRGAPKTRGYYLIIK